MGSCPITVSSGGEPFYDVRDTAAELIQESYAFGHSANAAANALVQSVSDMATGLTIPIIEAPTIAVRGITDPVLPVAPERPSLPSFVPAPSFGGVTAVSLPSFGDAPTADITYPEVNLSIAPPVALSAVVPPEPAIDVVSVPDAPSLALPAIPSLASITIPDIPTIDIPTFSETLGDAPIAPDTSFSFTEAQYTSDLLDSYMGLLATWVQGTSTGIHPDVELAIWNRGRDRESALYGSALTQIAKDFAARGFPIPPGAATALAHQAIQKAREGSSTIGRDIAIKQAELEQQNRQFALSETRQIELGMMNYASQIAQRSFEAAKYIIEAAVAVYGARVQQYNADVEAFKARAQVYRERIQGELAKLEVFKGEIEGQRLIASLNEQSVEVYKAQLQGVTALIGVYEAEVRAASVRADIAKNAIEVFKAQVGAYGEQVRAKASEYDAYATRIRAEVSKYELPKVQADVFRALTDAYSSNIKGQVEAKALEVKMQQELPMELFKSEVEAFNGQIRAVGEQVRAIADIYRADGAVYEAQNRAVTDMANVQVGLIRAEVEAGTAQANISIEASRANVANLLSQTQMMLEAAKSVTGAVSQLAAGAMSQLNLGASINASTSQGTSISESSSRSQSSSCSTNYSGSAD